MRARAWLRARVEGYENASSAIATPPIGVTIDRSDNVPAGPGRTVREQRELADLYAKEALERLEVTKGRISEYQVLTCLRKWGFAPNTSRQNVRPPNMKYVLSDTVGLVNNRRGGCAVRYETSAYPHFMRLLNKWLCERATGLEQGPVFTSITINKGYAGRIHRDKNNAGPSFIKSFGDLPVENCDIFRATIEMVRPKGFF